MNCTVGVYIIFNALQTVCIEKASLLSDEILYI